MFEVGKSSLLGPKILYDSLEKVIMNSIGLKQPTVGNSPMARIGEETLNSKYVILCI